MMNSVAPPPDELADLLGRCARGEDGALAALYQATAPRVLGCLLRILRRRALAEEALQDVFVQIWQRAAQFEEHRGRAFAWIVSIARYRAIDILRRERAESVDPFVLAESIHAETPADDTAPQLMGPDEALERCLGQLTEDQRESIRLAYLAGQSHQEIAATLDRPLGSVKSWIRRGLLALRECLEACSTPTPS
jgi:RNA polymerase sigma-70 factor (ECF subfamily)